MSKNALQGPTPEEVAAVRGVDFNVLLSDPLRRSILQAVVDEPSRMTAKQLVVKLYGEGAEVHGGIEAKLTQMRQLGVLTAERNGGVTYGVSGIMSVALQKYLSPRTRAIKESALSDQARKQLRTRYVQTLRAALREITQGTDEDVARELLRMECAPLPIHSRTLASKTQSARTALFMLVQHGQAAVLPKLDGGGVVFRYLESEKDGSESDESAPEDDVQPMQPLDIHKPSTPSAEELGSQAIESACLAALAKGPLRGEPLKTEVRTILNVNVQTARINKALAGLVLSGAVRRQGKGTFCLQEEGDEDDLGSMTSSLQASRSSSSEEVAARVQAYLREWQRENGDEWNTSVPEGPRTLQVRLRDYLNACEYENEKELSTWMSKGKLDPYDLFIAHQEFSDGLLSLQLSELTTARNIGAFRKRNKLSVLQATNLRAMFGPKDKLQATVKKAVAKHTTPLHPEVVRKYLQRVLPEPYRSVVL